MAEIKLYDYEETVEDGWWGSYTQSYYIGQGKLSSGVVVGQVEAVPDGEDIIVKINSVGGFVFHGWAIYNALVAAKAKGNKIIVRIEGLAASIASIIAMAGDEIIICQASLLMIHKPTGDYYWCGAMDAEDLKREAAALDQIQAVLNSIYRAKTSLDAATIDSMINAETWITPAEAVTLGFATSVEATIIPEAMAMAQNTFNHLFKNADAKTRAYANSTIKINRPMDVQETLKNNTEAMKNNNTLLNQLASFFQNLGIKKNEAAEAVNASSELASGGNIYFTGTLAVGTEVFSDEEMTTHVDAGDHNLADGNFITVDDAGVVTVMNVQPETTDATENTAEVEALNIENTALKAENKRLQEALNAANTSLVNSNTALQQIANVKSKFKPDTRDQEINENGNNAGKQTNADGKLDLSKEAREARREERESIANSKKTR